MSQDTQNVIELDEDSLNKPINLPVKTGQAYKIVISRNDTVDKIQVTEIRFESEVDVYYTRLITSHKDYIAPDVPKNPGVSSFDPKRYPEEDDNAKNDASKPSKPHWILNTSTMQPSESWPTVMIRDGATTASDPKRKLFVSFSSDTVSNGERIIKAESTSGELLIGEQTVTFENGSVKKESFAFIKVPSTVDKLSGVTLRWFVKKNTSDNFTEICQTKHTIFIVDEKPRKGNFRAPYDGYLFEQIDWSCSWARGKSGLKAVLSSIWKEFSPVKATHSTGLFYWRDKNWSQTLYLAIQSQDNEDPEARNNVTCAVFAEILINAVGLHGIRAAEITAQASDQAKSGFTKSGRKYKCIKFHSKAIKGQGMQNTYNDWTVHHITSIYDDSSSWRIYDPSYGTNPTISNEPIPKKSVDILNYEKENIRDFTCVDIEKQKEVKLLPDAENSSDPLHLEGRVVWVN